MTLFGHKRRAPRRPEEIAPPEIESRPPQTVGMMLRSARLRRGEDIEHVAALLRLRPSYVEAIEQGRYDELPGAAYALGFVRAYAEHLGLDGHEVVRRFKAEAAGLERRQDLSLPMPLSERSRPGGGLLLIALIVAGCAYALWWYLASSERTRPERVAAPPEEIAPGPPPPLAAIEPEPSPQEPAPPVAAEPPPDAALAEAASTPTIAAATPSEPEPGESASTASPGEPPAEEPADTAGPEASAAVPAPPPEAPGAAAPSDEAPAPPEPSAPPVTAALPPPPPPPLPDETAPGAPRVYGVTHGPVRIVIRATADSWIQIRDRDGSQARILKPGEIYRVPDRPGLTMRTGNAGGIDIFVDGKPAPPLGQSGQTRNAVLDPERLLAGTAIIP